MEKAYEKYMPLCDCDNCSINLPKLDDGIALEFNCDCGASISTPLSIVPREVINSVIDEMVGVYKTLPTS